jgi:guanylate kinase
MAEYVEIKAYLADPEAAAAALVARGAEPVRTERLSDTYFHATDGRLKYREGRPADGAGAGGFDALIAYHRLASPIPRESTETTLPLAEFPEPARLRQLLAGSLGERPPLRLHRRSYRAGAVRVHIDRVEEAGDFVEIFAEAAAAGGPAEARRLVEELRGSLGLTQADAVAWSYIDLVTMYRTAAAWRDRLAGAGTGRLILLDGASGTGKTTLSHMLLHDDELALDFVPRFSTREPRRNLSTESEYVFVTHAEFERLAQDGEFIEYRDFEFGMSYGVAWRAAAVPLLEGRDALAIVNLGNVRHLKRVFPEALAILIHTPPDTIRDRLVARGVNNEEQIEERIGNARTATLYRPWYDAVVENEEGLLEASAARLREIIRSHLRG